MDNGDERRWAIMKVYNHPNIAQVIQAEKVIWLDYLHRMPVIRYVRQILMIERKGKNKIGYPKSKRIEKQKQ